MSLQDQNLQEYQNKQAMVSIYLINGIRLNGYVGGFDQYVVILESNNTRQMIYKHSISTILPMSQEDAGNPPRFPNNRNPKPPRQS
jgi:host factor-I protein